MRRDKYQSIKKIYEICGEEMKRNNWKLKVQCSMFGVLLCAATTAVSPSITSFNTGQVSPLLEAYTNFQKYPSSSRTIENMLVAVQGPVFRRPGTKYIATQKSSSAVGKVAAYEHSVDDSYVLLFEDQVLRFFRDGGQILDSVGTEDISGLGLDNIIAHWLLNDTEGTNVVDDDGATHDITASTDIATLAADGKVNGAFDLDGQYDCELADHSDFSFTDDSNDSAFSLVCWAEIVQKNDLQVLLSKWKSSGATSEWRLSLSNDRKLQLHLSDGGFDLSGDAVSQWKLNEDAGNTSVVDTRGLQNGVSTVNTSTLSATGLAAMTPCFDLDAQYAVQVNDNASYSFGDSTNDSPFSIAAWVYVTPSGGIQHILSKHDETSGLRVREWRFYIDSTERLNFTIYDESRNGLELLEIDDPLTTGWHFVVGTYDGDESAGFDGMTLYVDGEAGDSTGQRTTGAGSYIAMENTATKVIIGGNTTTSGSIGTFWDDKIDNVVLFNIEITAADVSSLYNSGDGTEDLAAAGAQVSAIIDDAISIGWHFFTASYSAPADESTAASGIILYVDGVVVASTATNNVNYNAMQNGAEEIRIGSQRNIGDSANEKFWADKMDEVSVYGDVLTPAEVASLYSTTPYEITTPYLTADLFGLDFKKSEDVMFVSHGDHEPRQLTRTGHTNWTLTALGIDDGPFQAENTDTTLTITPSATTGAITLTASAELFATGHVGSLWQINQQRASSVYKEKLTGNGSGAETAFFVGGYSFTTELASSYDGTTTLERSTDEGSTWSAALTALTAIDFDNPAETEEDGAIYRVTVSGHSTGNQTYTFTITDQTNHGIVKITGVIDGENALATVLTDLVDTDATSRWAEGYWSDYRGWPTAVTIHQQRLVFGGSASFPQTIWFGKTDPDEYTNFTAGTLDTSAFTMALPGNNPIQWLLSQDYLLIGTSGSCGKYGEQGAAVTPTSPFYQEQTTHGTAPIRGIVAGDTVLYIERGARGVREFVFSLSADKYLSPDLTVLSPEITLTGIKDVAFQLRPSPILWCVLNSGDIATLTYEKEQAVIAWTKQITDGDFESVAIISGSDEDEVWVTVNRTISGADARYVEQFQPVDWGTDINDAWFVDSGLSYDGTAATDFNGLTHLIAEDMSIYADTIIQPDETVDANGAITIDRAAARVLAGLAFTSKLETLPLAIDPQDKPLAKRIRSVSFDLYKSGYMQYGNGASSTLTNINFKNDMNADASATAQGLYTSRVKPKKCSWPYGIMTKQTIYVETQQPMPLTIRSISPNYQIYP